VELSLMEGADHQFVVQCKNGNPCVTLLHSKIDGGIAKMYLKSNQSGYLKWQASKIMKKNY
jgi:hypothetical protein